MRLLLSLLFFPSSRNGNTANDDNDYQEEAEKQEQIKRMTIAAAFVAVR